MKTNKEKFLNLVSKEETNTLNKNKERIRNRKRLRESQAIAMKVLEKLEEPGWTQRRLAQEMGVSPQQITKIVKGKENLTLETIVKLQDILDIAILATYVEKHQRENAITANEKLVSSVPYIISTQALHAQTYTAPAKSVKMNYYKEKDKYEFETLTA
ncbi:helix-turn-helix transcriptional regulator [Carboxylicivirga sp. A043]|uniref:helix-turn-helix transcriptional regulator n=1 Tax=Carboxylicivirga litoralis TaxID=2816963 RepID=UPI0021CB66FF|nr:helix-turn-helix transcriptional regulator [Carboxylicivirga sp. A043]MCU4155228.1 helix-turn-helix transcriptional regulator [Carboxylicivirga sp. A043]